MSIKNIRIIGHMDFLCPIGVKASAAVDVIRSGYGLKYGYIVKNGGVGVLLDDIITADSDYQFINFQPIQPNGTAFFILSAFSLNNKCVSICFFV
jgi:hypothetical protein